MGTRRGVNQRRRFQQARPVLVGQVPHRDHDGRPRERQGSEPDLPRPAGHAEYLHAARGSRHICRGDAEGVEERPVWLTLGIW